MIQEIFPPVQMYIVLAIVATLCTIMAAKIRDTENAQLYGVSWVVVLLIVVAGVSVLQIAFVFSDELRDDAMRGVRWHVILHLFCILALYVLLIIWYFRSILLRSRHAD